MSRVFCCRLVALAASVLSLAVPAHAQPSGSSLAHTLATLPPPLAVAFGLTIGVAVGLVFLTVGVRLSRIYK